MGSRRYLSKENYPKRGLPVNSELNQENISRKGNILSAKRYSPDSVCGWQSVYNNIFSYNGCHVVIKGYLYVVVFAVGYMI